MIKIKTFIIFEYLAKMDIYSIFNKRIAFYKSIKLVLILEKRLYK